MAKTSSRRRSPGEGTIRYREDRDLWEAGITIGELKSGHPRRIRKLFASKTEAQVWLIDQQSAKQRGEINAKSDTTLGQFIHEWLEVKRATRAAKTVSAYEYQLKRFVLPELGPVRLYELTPMHVQRLVNKLRRNTTPFMVAKTHGYLKLVLGEAVRLELMLRNVAAAVQVSKPRRRELTRWSPEEAGRVLEYVYNSTHPLRHYVHVALTTGMRREELLGLRWVDVNLELLELRVQQCVTFVKGKALIGPTKNEGSQRTIYLDEDTITAFRRQREEVQQLRAINRHKWNEHGLVFPSRTGTPYGESGLGKAFRSLCQTVGVTPIRVYDLRSTWASNALEAGVDIKVVSERLGHSDVRFTLQVYVRTVESQHRKAALGTQALYGSKPDLTSKTIDVKARPAKKKPALPRAQKALPERATGVTVPAKSKRRRVVKPSVSEKV